MRLHCVVLFVVAALVASVEASVGATESKAATPKVQLERALTDWTDTGIKRRLRAEKAIEDDDKAEERGAISSLTTKLKNLLKSKKLPKVAPKVDPKVDPKVLTDAASMQKELVKVASMPKDMTLPKKLQTMARKQKSTDDAFSTFKLGEEGARLFKADALPAYVRFSELTVKQRGGQDMYGVKTLLHNFGEKKVITIANAGLNSKNELSVATAERMRAGLISKWWGERKSVQDVTLMLKDGGVTLSQANKEVVKTYMNAYNKAYITNVAV
ncbi:hypothetical protein PHYPSEUDO_002029 [Phytophthora pseudosyringae]|uniref:RxLR effector protein n=1 Tax=Phytophthora pseudosyringae TaxID=221518 RepID=A0A8T1VUV2_9STRA|nr:hypothetical protein PHYPSEUDO_002029 [Phytophthora pseudosyringae]